MIKPYETYLDGQSLLSLSRLLRQCRFSQYARHNICSMRLPDGPPNGKEGKKAAWQADWEIRRSRLVGWLVEETY